MLATFRTLYNALAFGFPEVSWDVQRFASKDKKSNQWWLCTCLRMMYPDIDIQENYLHPNLSWDLEGMEPRTSADRSQVI